MSEVATADDGMSAFMRWSTLFAVTLATTLYATTILVVSVILPQMQGTLSATQDQIAWVVTFNILATAVVTPMSGWLTAKFGRRKVMLYCIGAFTVSTFLCGIADSLVPLVLYRIAQGGFGAPLIPLAQATILDIFPKHQHQKATAIFGMSVVVGPIIGPTLGGFLSELLNWRWAFFMLVPAGVLAHLALWLVLKEPRRHATAVRLDWTGFLSLSVAVVALQLMLDRGQRLDWFNSVEINIEAALAVIAFYVFTVHILTTEEPFLNPRRFLNRNYSLGLILVTIYGMLNFTPMILLPPMLQNLMGYPDSIIGTLLAFRGAGATLGFFLAIFVGRLDPRVGITVGFVAQALSGWYMASFDINVTAADVALTSFVQGISVGLIWVPLTVATFATIESEDLAETSAVYHLLRNIGSSVFISLSVTTVIRTATANYAGMTEFITPYNESLLYPTILGQWNPDTTPGLAALSGEIQRQALMIGYLNAFGLYTIASLSILLLVFLVKPPMRQRPST
ncbi:MAG: DHA2 family efflux MFS transporter permease subunit [Alphaproteobacteria bacterium]|jgi:DHA2 family multidrug resistance protein|nr:DHA2 family efflux MFS transporter permease subunit [Alphaproteobacteria bacterium]